VQIRKVEADLIRFFFQNDLTEGQSAISTTHAQICAASKKIGARSIITIIFNAYPVVPTVFNIL
jgi:hypothetical protein